MNLNCRCTIVAVFLTFASTTYAQNNELSYSVGPQLSTLGIGVTGGVRIQSNFSVSADLNFLPYGNVNEEIDDITYDLSPKIRGAVLMANFHPGGKSFSVGLGVMLGGYKLEAASSQVSGTVEIGDQTYTSSSIGELTGDFQIGGPSLAVHLGWRGKGFNFGLGIFTVNKSASLNASGPLGNDPSFRANVDQEIDNALSELDVIPVIPYLRIGYQFGL